MYAGFGLPLKPKNIGRYFILHFPPLFIFQLQNFLKKTSSKRRTCRPIQVIPQSNVAEKYCRRNMHALFWCYCLIEDWTWGRDVFSKIITHIDIEYWFSIYLFSLNYRWILALSNARRKKTLVHKRNLWWKMWQEMFRKKSMMFRSRWVCFSYSVLRFFKTNLFELFFIF